MGETYVEAMVGTPRFVNPLLAASDTDSDLTHLVYSGLTRVVEHGDLMPDMASGWQINHDAKVFTFTLRPDARWHDGQPLTADDVLFTVNLVKDKAFPGNATLAETWQRVEVGAPNRETVLFKLYEPNASFLQQTTLGILPRHHWSEVKVAELGSSPMNRAPIGSGPWRYVPTDVPLDTTGSDEAPSTAISLPVQIEAGVLLEPADESDNESMSVSRLWFRQYPMVGAAITGLRMGEAHGMGHIPPDYLPNVESIPGVTLHEQALARYAMLILNTRSPLLDKPETRRAIELAIDRRALIDVGLGGRGRVADGPVLTSSWAYDPRSAHTGSSPAEARRLLDVAGWTLGVDGVRHREGMTLTLVLAASKDVPQNVAVARQVEQQLENVGIDVQVATVGRDNLLRDYLGPGSFHIVLANWEAQGPEPDLYDYWHSSQAVPGSLNFAGWRSEKADGALQAFRQLTERSERSARLSEFQQAFRDDVPAVILYNPIYTYATRSPATGVELPPTHMLSPAQRFDTIGGWRLER
jgi:peptide/nickel transport system substrate-binding protein